MLQAIATPFYDFEIVNTLVYSSPEDGQTGVALTTEIVAYFDARMNTSAVENPTGGFQLVDQDMNVCTYLPWMPH